MNGGQQVFKKAYMNRDQLNYQIGLNLFRYDILNYQRLFSEKKILSLQISKLPIFKHNYVSKRLNIDKR